MNLYSKAGFTVGSVVVHPKDPLDMEEQCGVICRCDVCGEVYVEDTEGSLEQGAEEQAKLIEKGIWNLPSVGAVRLQDIWVPRNRD